MENVPAASGPTVPFIGELADLGENFERTWNQKSTQQFNGKRMKESCGALLEKF